MIEDIYCFLESESLTEEEIELLEIDIEKYYSLIDKIKYVSQNNNVIADEEINNNIIFMDRDNGQMYAENDLKSIPLEVYNTFAKLLESIQKGTFIGFKNYSSNNNEVDNLYILRKFQSRVIYKKINYNTFIVLGIFLKKHNWDKLYVEKLISRYKVYMRNKSIYDVLCSDENYIYTKNEAAKIFIDKLKSDKKVI